MAANWSGCYNMAHASYSALLSETSNVTLGKAEEVVAGVFFLPVLKKNIIYS